MNIGVSVTVILPDTTDAADGAVKTSYLYLFLYTA